MKTSCRHFGPLLKLLVLSTLTLPASAVTVITDFDPGTQSFAASLSVPTGRFGPFGPFPNRATAFSFTTGTQSPVLGSLTFGINPGNASLSPALAEIHTGSPITGGQTATALGSVTPTSAPTTQSLTVIPGPSYPLDPGTTYWIHLTVPSGSAVYAQKN